MLPIYMLADASETIPVIAVGGGLAVGVVSIITSAIRKTKTTQAKEESRREIAAYVAEGSMTADDAAKLINAGKSLEDRLS